MWKYSPCCCLVMFLIVMCVCFFSFCLFHMSCSPPVPLTPTGKSYFSLLYSLKLEIEVNLCHNLVCKCSTLYAAMNLRTSEWAHISQIIPLELIHDTHIKKNIIAPKRTKVTQPAVFPRQAHIIVVSDASAFAKRTYGGTKSGKWV